MGPVTNQSAATKSEAACRLREAAAARTFQPNSCTEDLGHTQVHGSVRAQNPFLDN